MYRKAGDDGRGVGELGEEAGVEVDPTLPLLPCLPHPLLLLPSRSLPPDRPHVSFPFATPVLDQFLGGDCLLACVIGLGSLDST